MIELHEWRRVVQPDACVCVECGHRVSVTEIAVEAGAAVRRPGYPAVRHERCWESAVREGRLNPRARVLNVRGEEPWDVYVGRGRCPRTNSRDGRRYANAWTKEEYGENALRLFLKMLHESPLLVTSIRLDLRGRSLGCWCKPGLCHGDMLAMIANGAELGAVDAWLHQVLPKQLTMFGLVG